MSIRRMRWFGASATKTWPASSTTIPCGESSCASVAGPPSPDSPAEPVPATVVMIPSGPIRRTRWLSVSTTKMLPSGAESMVRGARSLAAVAGPPSPEKPELVPAIVSMTPEAGDGGDDVSTTQPCAAGLGSGFSAGSVARTSNVCAPSARPE